MPRKKNSLQGYWEDRLTLDAENLVVGPLFETLTHGKFTSYKLYRVAYDVMNDDITRKKINPRRKAVLDALLGALRAEASPAELVEDLIGMLHSAVIEEDPAMARFILSWGAKPNTEVMTTALDFPQDMPRALKILEALLKAGGKITGVKREDLEWSGLGGIGARKINAMTPRQVVERIRAHVLAQELEDN